MLRGAGAGVRGMEGSMPPLVILSLLLCEGRLRGPQVPPLPVVGEKKAPEGWPCHLNQG